MDVDNFMSQVSANEFSTMNAIAATMTAERFAAHVKGTILPWGANDFYKGVRYGGTDYLWRASDGKFDGWDRNMMDGDVGPREAARIASDPCPWK